MDPSVQLTITPEFLKGRPLSKSSLSKFWISPQEYIYYLTEKRKVTDDMILGNAVECKLLQESKYNDKFTVADKPDCRNKDNKAMWENLILQAKEAKQTLISEELDKKAGEMVEAAKRNKNVMYWVERCQNYQRKLSWTDKKTGLPFTGFIDFEVEIEEHLTIIEVKTDAAETPDKFFKNVYDDSKRHDLQIGSYLTGYHKQFYKFPDFMFLVFTKSAPYDAYMVHVPPDLCQAAKDEFDHLQTAFKYCLDNNQFNMGVDFWLFDTMPYFNLERPKYVKSHFNK